MPALEGWISAWAESADEIGVVISVWEHSCSGVKAIVTTEINLSKTVKVNCLPKLGIFHLLHFVEKRRWHLHFQVFTSFWARLQFCLGASGVPEHVACMNVNFKAVRESRLTWPFVPSQHSQPNTQSFVFTWFYIMTKEELQNYRHNKTTTTPETTKQEDFRQPPAHARFTHVHSRARQFGECHHTHNNSHSTTRHGSTFLSIDLAKIPCIGYAGQKQCNSNRFLCSRPCVYWYEHGYLCLCVLAVHCRTVQCYRSCLYSRWITSRAVSCVAVWPLPRTRYSFTRLTSSMSSWM